MEKVDGVPYLRSLYANRAFERKKALKNAHRHSFEPEAVIASSH